MKTSVIIFFSLFFFNSVFSQSTTVSIQPDNSTGQDAYVWDYMSSTSIGSQDEISIYAWTYSGTPTIRRVYIRFDLSGLPSNAIIDSAKLTLYNCSTCSSSSGEHQQLSGSNAMILRRVVDAWDESTITWNNQPGTSNTNQVTVPASTSIHQTYNIDVTNLVQDMVTSFAQSYGFQLKLITEEYYRSVIFASSEHADSSLHPKIKITYHTVGVEENYSNPDLICVYPNPSKGKLAIASPYPIEKIEILSIEGKLIQAHSGNRQLESNINIQENGYYLFKVITDKAIFLKKVVIQE